MPTLKELSVQFAKKQPKQVDYVTENSPILAIIPFEESSHAMHNVYSEVKSITGAGFVDLDSPLPNVAVNTILKQLSLSVMGGELQFGEDEAQMVGGRDAFAAKKTPAILRQSGMNAEYAILYNMIRAWAIANGKKINAGGSSNVNHCILAVRFASGETAGLYSPNGFADGALLPFEWLNGGNLMKIKKNIAGAETEINGYAGRFKNYFGFQIANPLTVAGIFNIDRISQTKKLPTKDQIDDLLDMVRADSNTYLFMHPKVKSALNTYKDTPLKMDVFEKRFDRRIDFWHDVPLFTSYNFLDGTEANVSFS